MAEQPLILLVEDEPLVRLSLAAYLEDCGFRCLQAGDGLEGLEIFDRNRPDLVVTDLRMSGLDGFGVISALRDRSPGTPVVVLTGTGEASAVEDASAAGARACLLKPLLDMGLMVDAIRSILGNPPEGGLR